MKEDLTAFTAIFLTGITAFLAPSFVIIGVLVFTAIVDYFFGIWRARKTKERIMIFNGLWATITKGLIYTLLIWVALGADRFIINDLVILIAGKLEVQLIFTKVVALLLFSIEVFSINKNYKAVKGVSIPTAFMQGIRHARGLVDEVAKIKNQIKN